MRPLKFRVYDKEAGEYLEGEEAEDFVLKLNGDHYVEISCGYYNKGQNWVIEQYTGLKDKNGKEIYEGDIVRWSFKGMNNRLIHTADAVEWKSYAEEEWPYSTISGFTLPDSEDGYEVVGNIHENPELLSKEGE